MAGDYLRAIMAITVTPASLVPRTCHDMVMKSDGACDITGASDIAYDIEMEKALIPEQAIRDAAESVEA
jgi:predicted nicotinamide N-methyase